MKTSDRRRLVRRADHAAGRSAPGRSPRRGELHSQPTEEEVALPEWQAAIEVMLVVELNGLTMFARIGMIRALNRGHVREFNPARKDTHWGKRKPKRDQ
jgi:hypothetical protein